MNTQQAINMIRDHGFHASMTADGLIANMEYTDCRADAPGVLCETGDQYDRKDGMMIGNEYVRFTDDVYFTETTVFAVDDNGHVDSTAIRAFLGY